MLILVTPLLLSLLVVLHVCEVHGESFDDEWLDGVEHEDLRTSTSSIQPTKNATDIRNALMLYFSY